MQQLTSLFGESPFNHLVHLARKVHECVKLIDPIAEAILQGNMEKIRELQHEMSTREYEADLIKDDIRENLPTGYFLPVNKADVAGFLRQLDRMADDAEDFAVVATFRRVDLPVELREDFKALVRKVVEVSEKLLGLAEHLAQLQRESFIGQGASKALDIIKEVCRMEWESDKLNRQMARRYFGQDHIDTATLLLLEKFCKSLGGIADHAENVGKNLRLMIIRN